MASAQPANRTTNGGMPLTDALPSSGARHEARVQHPRRPPEMKLVRHRSRRTARARRGDPRAHGLAVEEAPGGKPRRRPSRGPADGRRSPASSARATRYRRYPGCRSARGNGLETVAAPTAARDRGIEPGTPPSRTALRLVSRTRRPRFFRRTLDVRSCSAAPLKGEEVVVNPRRSRSFRRPKAPSRARSRSRDSRTWAATCSGRFRCSGRLERLTANSTSEEGRPRRMPCPRRKESRAYHLKDFDNALSVVAVPTFDLDLRTGRYRRARRTDGGILD